MSTTNQKTVQSGKLMWSFLDLKHCTVSKRDVLISKLPVAIEEHLCVRAYDCIEYEICADIYYLLLDLGFVSCDPTALLAEVIANIVVAPPGLSIRKSVAMVSNRKSSAFNNILTILRRYVTSAIHTVTYQRRFYKIFRTVPNVFTSGNSWLINTVAASYKMTFYLNNTRYKNIRETLFDLHDFLDD